LTKTSKIPVYYLRISYKNSSSGQNRFIVRLVHTDFESLHQQIGSALFAKKNRSRPCIATMHALKSQSFHNRAYTFYPYQLIVTTGSTLCINQLVKFYSTAKDSMPNLLQCSLDSNQLELVGTCICQLVIFQP
jgi:hypothetical protein